jgi:hypothetical protein
MNWIVANVKWIMLVCGALRCTMIYAAIAPQAALRSTSGEGLEGQLAENRGPRLGSALFAGYLISTRRSRAAA